jgi:hypothetical protein
MAFLASIIKNRNIIKKTPVITRIYCPVIICQQPIRACGILMPYNKAQYSTDLNKDN